MSTKLKKSDPCNYCKTINGVKAKCRKCELKICTKCSVLMGNSKFCEPCATAKEHNNLETTIFKALDYLKGDNVTLIIKCITDFSMGWILKCCNKNAKCREPIIIDSIVQFEKKKDHNNKTIYYYTPKYLSINKPTIIINNRKYRLFCNFCKKNKLNICSLKNCKKKESNSIEMICGLHPNCYICSISLAKCEWDQKFVCKSCKNMFCDDHILNRKCEECYIKDELRMKKVAIRQVMQAIYNIYIEPIFQLIAEYSMGYAIECICTKVRHAPVGCGEDIAFDNKFQYDKGLDCMDKKPMFWGSEIKNKSDYLYFGYVKCSDCVNRHNSANICGISVCNRSKGHVNFWGANEGMSKCWCCGIKYCDQHINLVGSKRDQKCEECWIMDELNVMKKAIKNVFYGIIGVYDESIIECISEYAVGYIAKCYGKEDCKNVIIWENKFQMKMKRDDIGKELKFINGSLIFGKSVYGGYYDDYGQFRETLVAVCHECKSCMM
eukprot:148740_1